MGPPLQIASIEEGAFVLRIGNLRNQASDASADVRAAAAVEGLSLHTAHLWLLDNDTGWSQLPALLKRLIGLGVSTLDVENAVILRWGHQVDMVPRGDYVARALGSIERPPHLTGLALRSSGLTDAGLERIAGFCAGLAHLDLSGNDMPDAGLRIVGQWGDRALHELRYDGNVPTARGIAALTASSLPRLSRLTLRNCRLGAVSLRRLTEGGLPALTDLALGANALGDEGAEVLAEAERFASLSRLELAACAITDAGAKKLAASPHLQGISELDLRGNRLGDRGRKLLHDRFGDRVRTGQLPAPPSSAAREPP